MDPKNAGNGQLYNNWYLKNLSGVLFSSESYTLTACQFIWKNKQFFILKIEEDGNIPIYIQQDATLHSLFISVNCCTCFGWYHHPSSGVHTIVSTAYGICHTVTPTCRDSDR
jgi:hypothetical protein